MVAILVAHPHTGMLIPQRPTVNHEEVSQQRRASPKRRTTSHGSFLFFDSLAIDMGLENVRGLEDMTLRCSMGTSTPVLDATDTLAFAAHGKRAEAREFHSVTANEGIADFAQDLFDQSCCLVP
jgi:hypothetical protein